MKKRVLRGGSCISVTRGLIATWRLRTTYRPHGVGFRVVVVRRRKR